MLTLLRYFALSFGALTLLTFAERLGFALYHANVREGLALGDILHALFWGLRFDLAVSAALALVGFLVLYLWVRLLRRSVADGAFAVTFLAATLLVLLQGADLLYFSEAGRHLGYELKEFINSAGELAQVALKSFALPVLLQLALLIPLFFALRRLFRARAAAGAQGQPGLRFGPEAGMLAILLIAVFFIRGGLTHVPLSPLQAQSIGDNAKATLALNGAYNALFAAISPHTIKPVIERSPSDEERAMVARLYQGHGPLEPVQNNPARLPNIVMVFLESWSAAYMGAYGYERTATPFFDSLRPRSLSTRAMLAGGHRTTEGMFSSLCSWQNPLGKTVAQSQLQDFDYRCLPRQLKELGYHSAFFQGTNKDTSGTGAFAQLLGFTESYGKRDISERAYPPNSWGLHDPDLYRFTLKKMRAMSQPLLIGINTNSTHDLSIPPGVEAPFGNTSQVDKYLNTLHFADQALADFIHTIQSDEALKDTLFVLVADHTAMPHRDLMQKYSVPFLIHHPERVAPRHIEATVSQRDIAPTLQLLLGLPASPWFSGQSLLQSWPRRFADFYHQGVLGWVEGERIVEQALGQDAALKCFRLKEAGLARASVPCGEADRELSRHALGFAALSQSLLFSGTIRHFPDNLAPKPMP